MKKKALLTVLFALSVVAVTGCDKKAKDEPNSPTQGTEIETTSDEVQEQAAGQTEASQEKEPEKEIETVKETESEKETAPAEDTESAVPEGMQDASLADHLNEGGTIRMEATNDAYTEPGKSYTLDELYDTISLSLENVWGETNPKKIQSISCAPIDRGGQVTTQFFLRIEASDDEGNDPLTIYYDVNKLGTDYVAVNMNENYYRSFATVNKYGVCSNGGSGGAAIHYDGYDMTDADGTPVRIYMCETDFALKDAMISRYSIPEDYTLPEDYPEDDFAEDGIIRYVYSFEPEPAYDYDKMGYADGYDDYLRGQVYVFEKDGESVFPDDKYMKIYDEIGIKVVDQKEMDRMIADRLSELGLTEDMLKQPFDDPSLEPEWVTLR